MLIDAIGRDRMKTKYKHIYFEKQEGVYNNKPWYLCRNNKSKAELGGVCFFSNWRKYVFEPEDDSIFDESCLFDIIHFLKQI